MQVKKFEAPTIQEALETIKRELGPEAIILSTKKHKKGFGLMSKASVEVTAAVSDRSIQKKQFTETRLPPQSREAVQKLPADKQAAMYESYLDKHLDRAASKTRDRVEVTRQPQRQNSPAAKYAGAESALVKPTPATRPATTRRYVDIEDEDAKPMARSTGTGAVSGTRAIPAAATTASVSTPDAAMQDELQQLKQMIEELKSTKEEMPASGAEALAKASPAFATPVLQDAFDQLVVQGLDRRNALALVKEVAFELGEGANNPDAVLDQIAAVIMECTKVKSLIEGTGPSIVAIVGPTGVGKTTTVAKIASEAILRKNLKVGLINLDSYKVAAFDQLATYSKILNVPFRSAASTEDLKAAIGDFQSLDLILIDTTGRSHKDPDSLKQMQAMIAEIPGARTGLVLSATTRDSELYEMCARFGCFQPEGVIFSKLDEASHYGTIVNVQQKTRLPLLYFTTGQRVPEDIEEATKERVASLVLDL